MLRSSRLRTVAPHSFICSKCLAKLHSASKKALSKGVKNHGSLSRLENHAYGQRSLVEGSARCVPSRYASTENLSNKNFSYDVPPPDKPISIRQRLRKWEIENAASFALPREIPQTAGPEDLRNSLTSTDDGDDRRWIELDTNESDEDVSLMAYDRYELLDLGSRRGFLLAGDLVELRAVARKSQELAIFVRELDNQSQFYTMSGKWINRSSQSAQFFVPHFVDPAELGEILPYLPHEGVPSGLQNKLHEFPTSVPRDLGKPLILKMLDFWAKSDAVYQAASNKLDNIHEYVSSHQRFTYATLEQIAENVLPAQMLRAEDGKSPPHALYAVHRSLLRDDIGFRPQMKGTLRTGGQYEISPRNELWNIKGVCAMVRLYREQQAAIASGSKRLPKSQLEHFATTAQRLIDHSRRSRQFTPCGTIGPSEKWQESDDNTLSEVRNSLVSGRRGQVVAFLESWAAFSSIAHNSSLNGIGSEILRVIGRYGEVDLNPTTAWTFLQEIGIIAPWESRVPFDLRLGRVNRYSRVGLGVAPSLSGESMLDSLQKLRKDWGDLPVYCIDDPGAHEIDDGISIESTSIPGEYWVHVHTADPASHIKPQSEAAAFAESATENVFMPERVFGILHKEVVKRRFSLDSDRPSMTMSARMNREGHILESKITPGTIHNVLFFSPAVVEEVVLGPSSSKVEECLIAVGPEYPASQTSEPLSRPMLQAHEICGAHKRDLQLLHEIGEAHAALLRANGGVDQNFPTKPKMSVSIPGGIWENNYNSEPSVQFSTMDGTGPNTILPTQGNLVQSFMLVAAQVAARWCNARGIPVPYRVTPRNPAKEDPSGFFLRKVLPSRAEIGVASVEITSEYLRLIGGVLPSSAPGPHAAVGVDMMVRCTSPLRRFTDLLVHWQIGATLLEEDRLGQSLVGNIKDDFLPFSQARVDALLPHLDTREKLIKYGNSEAHRHWLCYFLFRARNFKEAELPSTFTFLVRKVDVDQRKMFGNLVDFSARAQCLVPDEIKVEEIQVGDKLEVELENINVYNRKILVKALRQLEATESV